MVGVHLEGGVDEALVPVVADLADRVLATLERDTELSVVLCDDAFMEGLNRQWRGVEAATDVLSFAQEAGPGEADILGDVVISTETAARQADSLGHSLETELAVLLVHGVLHLCGHDHETADETQAMTAAEQRLMNALGMVSDGLVGRVSET